MSTVTREDAIRRLNIVKARYSLAEGDEVFRGIMGDLAAFVQDTREQLCRNRHDDYQQGLKQGTVRFFDLLAKLVSRQELDAAQKVIDDMAAVAARQNGEDIE